MSLENLRLLQVIAGAEQGGAERFFERLTIGLHQRGVHQHIVMRPFQGPMQIFHQHSIPLTTAPFRRMFDWSSSRIIRQVIENYKPNIVLTWMSRASDITPRSSAIFVARLGGYYDLKYYQKADYLVGNTRDIVDYFHHHNWPEERTCYLPNFPDIPQKSGRTQRADFYTPEDAPLLLALGRFHDDKAFDILIPALAQIPEAYLWLGGEGPEDAKLRDIAKRYGVEDRIRFLGWRLETSDLYQACDVYVCPSRVEPLGNVILEAWAHRKPVVAANSAGPRGLICHEKNGLLVEMNHIDQLAQAIQRIIHDQPLRHQIAGQGFKTYQENFTQEAVIEAYMTFFHTILQNQKDKI